MSGHETIRVLEVEVYAPQPLSELEGKSEVKAEEAPVGLAEKPEVSSTQDGHILPQITGGVGKL